MNQILDTIKHFVLYISKVQLKNATAIKHFLHKTKTQKANATEKNLYTILRFKDKEDFENWTNQRNVTNQEIWQLYASSLVKDMDHPENKGIARNIIENVATNAVKKEPGNINDKAGNEIKQQLNDLENNKTATQAKKKIIKILSEVDEEQALAELQVIKKQAEDFVQGKFYQDNKKEFEKPGTAASLFVKMQGYITSLEKLADNKILTLLSKRIRTLSTKYPNSSDEMNNAMGILANNELREFYDRGIKDGTLSPVISYEECKTKMEDLIYKEKQILKGDLKKVEELIGSITESISIINEKKQSIFHCINHQNDCVKEMEGKRHRYRYFQQKIDIYQKNIDEYQKNIDKCINPMQQVFDSLSQKTRATNDMMEFKSMIDSLQKKHPSEKRARKLSILTYLSNTQDQIRKLLADHHPVTMHSPATNLSQTKHDHLACNLRGTI
ncbi:hypothetical protein IC220_05820 [Wolbachia endosymbiont of Pentalonia nigronervosa]|uniref:hypothetical protein n=1 Tax=Wolbachia endosymbiont of Pentalonia nigronervosa TaxID=1301914 RepID=UPI00165F2F69|nr:hypothetical protein [Wolbachia endosymbiont of Pentalonia nigronervosa]MBD0391942.1 hypothetical protein [Wolbachia endosymbiont of Pentalonia nigronervosa]